MVEWLTPLLLIREVPVSNLGPGDTAILTDVFMAFLSSSSEFRDGTLKLGHKILFPNPLEFIIHLSSYYRRYVVWLLKSVVK
jgi:hypothetical protein